MVPSYRAGYLRGSAIEAMRRLERETGSYSIATGELGPPKLTKLLYEAHLLKLKYKTLEAVVKAGAEEISDALWRYLQRNQNLRNMITSIGIPILPPDGERLLRGPRINVPEYTGQARVAITSPLIDEWTERGWIDLRQKNIERWQRRFSKMLRSAQTIHHHGSAAITMESYRSEDIRIGEVVGWIFNNEEEGYRIKMKISYNWLGELVQLTLNPKELAERMTMVGIAVDSVERLGDDHILDFDLTSNRPDALSHRGIAREAALVCGTSLKQTEVALAESGEPAASLAAVEILDPALCPRYAARVIRGVKVGPSPKWLVDRLESIGQRSVNNIADITNYVMFEMGQPTHAFDLNLLHGRRIIVRRARSGEQLTTLDGFARELSPEMLMIADEDRVVAVAGVMGGEETEINNETTDVLLESAYFTRASVRATARALGLDTEASYRFSRGADPNAQAKAADRVSQLIAEIAGGQIAPGVIDVRPVDVINNPVALRVERVERLTGLRVSTDDAARILRTLEFDVEIQADQKTLMALAPSFRVDIAREEDLVEEVARHAGYDLVDTTLPAWSGTGNYLANDAQRRRVRRVLIDMGFNEAITFSFVNGERDARFRAGQPSITLANPIDVDRERDARVAYDGARGIVAEKLQSWEPRREAV